MGGGTKSEHLLCTLPYPEPKAILDRLRKNHPGINITYKDVSNNPDPTATDSLQDEIWKEATILVTLSALPSSAALCPNLSLIHFFSAGTNHIATSPIYTHTTIPLTTSSGIHGPQIAEWILMALLVSSHHYNQLYEWQKQHRWGKNTDSQSRMRTIHDAVGMRLGVLGYGSIGRQAARVCAALGMDVIAYTASPRETKESKKDAGFIVSGTGDPDGSIPSAWYSGLDKESLHHFLAQDIDVLLISVPLTKETTHFLAEAEFRILAKKNAFVANISRGQIVQQDDLIAALRAFEEDTDAGVKGIGEGKRGLRGAALDVTDPEPLPEKSELWDAPNCIVTPHISGLGTAYTDRAFQVLEVNLKRKEEGKDLINVVDRRRGY